MNCPKHPNEELVYEAHIAAPGYGVSYTCPQGHHIIQAGGLYDPDDHDWSEEPPWILSIDDVR